VHEYWDFVPTNLHHDFTHIFHDVDDGSINPSLSHHVDPHYEDTHQRTFPERLEQITVDNLKNQIRAAAQAEARTKSDRNEYDKLVEANDELMKLLSNHKITQRNIHPKHLASSSLQPTYNRTEMKNSSDETKKRRKRSFFGLLSGKKDDVADGAKEVITKTKSITDPLNPLHPPFIAHENKWLAGCLMNCIFHKTHSLDKYGYPTLDGIVDLYTSGTADQPFFMYVLRATNKCLKIISKAHKVHRDKFPMKGASCDIAYELFDCVTDAIIAYCDH
jgi:hypothetical protein